MVIETGKNPNAFTLPDQKGRDLAVSDLKNCYKLLSFHPLAWTEISSGQMKDLEDNYDRFEDLNTVPLGISVDPVPAKRAWSEDLQLEKLKILSDFYPLGFAARMMGIFIESEGFSGRANILLDERGKVIWTEDYDISELPDIARVLQMIEKFRR